VAARESVMATDPEAGSLAPEQEPEKPAQAPDPIPTPEVGFLHIPAREAREPGLKGVPPCLAYP